MITKEKKHRTGALRQIVDVERYTTTSDGMGGTTQEWPTHVSDLPVDIKPLSGAKRLEFAKLDSTITHEIIMRYRDDINTQDRINYKGRSFTLKYKLDEGEESALLKFGAAEQEHG